MPIKALAVVENLEALQYRFDGQWRYDILSGCLVWQAPGRMRGGYGVFSIDGKNTSAHRAAWLLFRGPIPKGWQVCHACDNRLCVNLEHLWLGTATDNMRDMVEKGRQMHGDSHYAAKLTRAKAEEIRKIYAEPDHPTCAMLAKTYGVCSATIAELLRGETWK